MGIANVSMFLRPMRMNIKRAGLLLDYEHPSYRLDRERGGLDIEQDPIKLQLDNRAFRDSLGYKSIDTLADDLVERSKRAVLGSIEKSCREGEALASPRSGGIGEIARMRMKTSIETMLVFIPEPPSISWRGGSVSFDYTPDDLRFDWRIGRVKIDYEPYSVEIDAG